jgi:hypothetical protein
MRILTASLILVFGLPLPAAAFEFSGASLTLEHRQVGGADRDDQLHFTGDVELGFGAGLSVQLGIKNTDYDRDPSFSARGHELHLIWRPSQVDGLALGLFAGEEYLDDWYDYKGIEARYERGGFSGEIGLSDYDAEGYQGRHINLQLGYRNNDRFSVFVGRNDVRSADGDFQADHTYLGGNVALAKGVSLYGSFGRNSYDTVNDLADDFNLVTLGVRYDLGKGVTFRQHSYNGLLPGD